MPTSWRWRRCLVVFLLSLTRHAAAVAPRLAPQTVVQSVGDFLAWRGGDAVSAGISPRSADAPIAEGDHEDDALVTVMPLVVGPCCVGAGHVIPSFERAWEVYQALQQKEAYATKVRAKILIDHRCWALVTEDESKAISEDAPHEYQEKQKRYNFGGEGAFFPQGGVCFEIVE